MDYRIFNGRTDVDACNFTQGVQTHIRLESALKVGSGRKIPCHTGELNLCPSKSEQKFC